MLPLALGRSGPDGLAPAFDLAAVARTRVTHRKPEPNPAVASPSGLMAAVGSATFPAGLMITPAVQSSSTLRAELRRRELQAAHRNADEDDADTDSGGLRPQLSPDAPADGAVPWRPEMLDELRAHRARLPGSMPKLRALCALVPKKLFSAPYARRTLHQSALLNRRHNPVGARSEAAICYRARWRRCTAPLRCRW
eukprot:SAG31_NODE_1846_length_7103_cov_82.594946_4_plen_196_part_00